jgi:hypothetical protein
MSWFWQVSVFREGAGLGSLALHKEGPGLIKNKPAVG